MMESESIFSFNNALKNKINFFESVIIDTFISCNEYRTLNIHSSSENSLCINELNSIYDELTRVKKHNENVFEGDSEDCVIKLQLINNKLSSVVKKYGTKKLINLLKITLGNEYIEKNLTKNDKYKLLANFFRPVYYKLLPKKSNYVSNSKNSTSQILEDLRLCDKALTLDCYEIDVASDSIKYKLNGIKIVFQDILNEQCLIVYGYLDDILISYCMSNSFILNKNQLIFDSIIDDDTFKDDRFNLYIDSLSLKEYLIYNVNELYEKYIGYLNNIKLIKNRTLSKIINDFLKSDFITKRLTIIQLLLHYDDNENQYLAYLLYDTMNIEEDNINNDEQSLLYNTLPWNIKLKFKGAMKQTIEYTNELLHLDTNNKIPLEQQICLLKVNDNVKEKAMIKLKEVKSKSDDTGTKARHYLDGLLKIPFKVFKTEQVMDVLDDSKYVFNRFIENVEIENYMIKNVKKNKCEGMEILKHINDISFILKLNSQQDYINLIRDKLDKMKKSEFYDIIFLLQNILHEENINYEEDEVLYFLSTHNANKVMLRDKIINLIQVYLKHNKYDYVKLLNKLNILTERENKMYNDYNEIKKNNVLINNFLSNVRKELDKSTFGHEDAKRQIERIIGSWITGKNKGYCLGFEGPPGVGKTSLAKYGLSNCLKDDDGNSRPFAFIAIGGSSNGSTLEGHNYTYVGSTWGRIVDILMETKCMNPIIFIDEIDKVSRTESGREIISILTHLVDPTQNDKFQDKYFSNIDLDLSRALFVFSYNDVELIDRILLDRIHRIKFDNLTLEDKLVICNDYMIPEILKDIGQENNIFFSDEILTYLIEKYTCEPGVRKLKELINIIVGEINLEILKLENEDIELPYFVSKDEIKNKFLKKKREAKIMTIHHEPKVGIINGLWANAMGRGGIIPIQVSFFPSNTFMELKLTGMQGDVMKESMNVSKTMAWNLTPREVQERLIKYFDATKNQGIHIHCPEGAVPKDGPSAGTAITIAIYSLLNEKKIRNDFAITGEINLQGNVTIIGGLDLKILGGINAGIKKFLFPTENLFDFNLFMEKYKNNKILENIEFLDVNHVNDALSCFLV